MTEVDQQQDPWPQMALRYEYALRELARLANYKAALYGYRGGFTADDAEQHVINCINYDDKKREAAQ